MPLIVTDSKGGKKGSPEWKHLGDNNKECPICRKNIRNNNENIEYVKTKRGSHIFIHTACVYKCGNANE